LTVRSLFAAPLLAAIVPVMGVLASHNESHPVAIPIGLDRYLPAPDDNAITAEKILLGRRLFVDRRLSADGRTACATCHQPARRFTDGRRVARGVFGRDGTRNTPTLLNRAYGESAFWDGRAASLEDQVRIALGGERDLGVPIDDAVMRVSRDEAYTRAFVSAFGGVVTPTRLAQAIATFVRAQLSGGSPFDRYLAGDRAALTDEQRRGLDLFIGRARCGRCHAGPLLSDERYHNTGIAWAGDRFGDAGRSAVTGFERDRGAFKTPTLRDVARTAPYMHDGTLPRLPDVVEFYDRGGRPNPYLDADIRPLRLSRVEKAALVAFLRSLNGG
jgi:cytochrome c peroxidase